MAKLINKKIETIVYGDKHTEYKIKYIFRTWFGYTYEKYDPIVFKNKMDAETFVFISRKPSKLIETGSYFHGIPCRGPIHEVYTIYDKDLEYCSVDPNNILNNDITSTDPIKVYITQFGCNIPTSKYYLARNNWNIEISPRSEQSFPTYHCSWQNEYDPVYESVEHNITGFIEWTKQFIEKTINKINDNKSKERLRNTIVSSSEKEYGHHEKVSRPMDFEQFKLYIETEQIYDDRNKVIQAELKRVDKYKEHLLTLIK